MENNLELIQLLASGLTAALGLGYITHRLQLSPIVGYLLAGVIIGPYTPGFTGDAHIAHQLAEIGVILLMFGVGLHFHLSDLLAVKGVAIPGAVGQSLVATILAMVIFAPFGIPWQSSLVIGMALAVASTVVLMRGLMELDLLNSKPGHVAVGWLIVEDIFTVVLLMIIPVLGGQFGQAATASENSPSIWMVLGTTFVKLVALVFIVLFVGARVIPRVMVHVARLRSRELFTLTVLVISIAIAAGSYYFFGASMALGAFLAGMVVAQSPVSHQAAADALPMRDAFAVIFFVSVGMLFNPSFLVTHPWMLLAALSIVLIAKPVTALVIVLVLGYSSRTALTVALGLSQIGEFSFILSDLARQHGLMTEIGHNLLVGTAILSITVNPLLFRALPWIENWLKRNPALWQLLNARAERRAAASNQSVRDQLQASNKRDEPLAIVVGYGPVGRSVHRLLKDAGRATVIIDLNMDTVSTLVSEGQNAIFGDASHESILEQAGMRRASHFVLTLPQATDRAAIVATARNLNPTARILVRAKYLSERSDLEQAGATAAAFEEVEAAVALARLVLTDAGMHRDAAESKIKDLRLQLIMENVSNIRSQRVLSVMIPWSQVRWLSHADTVHQVLSHVSQERFSRWPVIDRTTGTPVGYLLTKDLIASASNNDWLSLVRPLKTITPEQSIESALTRMQDDGDTVYAVMSGDRPAGLITLEDILEQVVGRIEDEYPHQRPITLVQAVNNGATLLNVTGTNMSAAIEEMVSAIPDNRLPSSIQRAELIQEILNREERISTDLGNGVAVPHTRWPDLPHRSSCSAAARLDSIARRSQRGQCI